MSPQPRDWNWRRIAAGAFALISVGYLIVFPVVDMILDRFRPVKMVQTVEDMTLAESVQLRTMEGVTGLTFFALGAAVGSFLNVVVYRAPRGVSIAFRRSACPSCGEQIEGRDNLPILGWLMLGGRCRTCQQPISSRYPIVETVVGAFFLLFFFVELISGGINLPVRRPNHYAGVVWIVFYTKWDLVGLYLFHCLTLCALLTWGLVDFDRQRIPGWLRWLAFLVLGGVPLIWPNLLPVTWLLDPPSGRPQWLASTAIMISVLGATAGGLLGWLASKAIRSQTDDAAEPPAGHATSAGVLVGLSLGWQAAVGVWLLTLALRPVGHGIARSWKRREPPLTLVLLVAYAIQLAGWRWSTAPWWPSAEATPVMWGITALALGSLYALNRALPVIEPAGVPKLPVPGQVLDLANDSSEA